VPGEAVVSRPMACKPRTGTQVLDEPAVKSLEPTAERRLKEVSAGPTASNLCQHTTTRILSQSKI